MSNNTGHNTAGNLRPPWKPGKSGNPKGRPRGSVSLVSALKRELRRRPEHADEIARAMIEAAKGGDRAALGFVRVLLDRLDGAVCQEVQVSERADPKDFLLDLSGRASLNSER